MAIGIVWAFVAAIFLGVFALPTKYVKNYEWENTWGAFYLIGMLIIPILVAVVALKGLGSTYAEISPALIAAVIALGFMWGCGNICWGLGIATIGMSLGFSILIGTVILSGSILPFFLGNAEKVFTIPGLVIIGGILVCVLGVAANGLAGIFREKAQTQGQKVEKKPMVKGLIICLVGGLLAAGCNLAFHVGGNVAGIARISEEQFGNPPYLAGLSVWMLVFIGGGISTCGFAIYLLTKNKTWNKFAVPGSGRNIGMASLMGLSHFACLFCYGLSAWKLGALGTSVGFAIFEAFSIIVANGLGLMTGEWKGADSKSMRWMTTGLTVLVLGIIVISIGNAMMAGQV